MYFKRDRPELLPKIQKEYKHEGMITYCYLISGTGGIAG